MDYQYLAYTEDRKVVRGTQAAATAEIAARILASHGYKVLTVRPIPALLPRWEQLFSPYLNKIKPQTIILFSRQLALLLESGTNLVTSLELLKMQTTSKYFKKVLTEVVADLRKGEHLSNALGKHPAIFSRMYVRTVAMGEQVGGIEKVLRQTADYIEKETTAAKGVRNAMRYPAVVAVVGLAVLAVLTIYVLPAFTGLYKQLGVNLPAVTRGVFSLATWLSHYGLFVLAFLGCVGLGVYIYGKTPEGRLQIDRIVLRVPVMGRIVQLNELVRCCRSMSILHKSGLPVSEVMGLVIDSSNNLVIKNALTQVHQDVLKGQGLVQPMARSQYFLPMMVQMVGVGEATGNLDTTLMSTAETFETEVEDRMHSLIELIQPAITVVMAIGVTILASALFSAMYSIYGKMG